MKTFFSDSRNDVVSCKTEILAQWDNLKYYTNQGKFLFPFEIAYMSNYVSFPHFTRSYEKNQLFLIQVLCSFALCGPW